MTESNPPSEAAKAFRDAGVDLCECYIAIRPKWTCDVCSMRLFDQHCARQTERLREALTPFATFADAFDTKPISNLHDELYGIHGGDSCGDDGGASLRLSACRAARAALAGKEDGRG